jgi:predicted metal-dependent enzyme (double-stranded beta helix superfamily)
MLLDIESAVPGSAAERPSRIASALQPYLRKPKLLERECCKGCPKGYIRHLLHANSAAHYAVVALVWRPGQMSPVHAHRTWCALGVYQGSLTEGYYAYPDGAASPAQQEVVLRPEGAVSYGPADPKLIHRIANLGMADAISIHVYGADFDRFGQDVNHVYHT